jgi:hypothetical protein
MASCHGVVEQEDDDGILVEFGKTKASHSQCIERCIITQRADIFKAVVGQLSGSCRVPEATFIVSLGPE